MELQASLALLNVSSKKQHTNLPDAFDRRPFEHEALRGVHNVSEGVKSYYVSKQKLANIAAGLGVDRVLRWKPKKVGYGSAYTRVRLRHKGLRLNRRAILKARVLTPCLPPPCTPLSAR